MPLIKGIFQKTMWAIFAPDGYIQFRTIAETRKESRELVIGHWEKGVKTWDDYAAAGFTENKISVDIKFKK